MKVIKLILNVLEMAGSKQFYYKMQHVHYDMQKKRYLIVFTNNVRMVSYNCNHRYIDVFLGYVLTPSLDNFDKEII